MRKAHDAYFHNMSLSYPYILTASLIFIHKYSCMNTYYFCICSQWHTTKFSAIYKKLVEPKLSETMWVKGSRKGTFFFC